METHFPVLVHSMDRGAWQATVLCAAESDMNEQLNATLCTVYRGELGRSFQVLIILYNTQSYHGKNKVASFSKFINSFRP